MEENAVREAASAGLQSVEKLIKLLSQMDNHHSATSSLNNNDSNKNSSIRFDDSDYKAVADVAVNKFRKVISLLDRTRTGHARFRRGPLSSPLPPPPPQPPQKPIIHGGGRSAFTRVHGGGGSQIQQRLPPLPQPKTAAAGERKDLAPTTINFSTSQQPISAANSYISSLTGDTESLPASMSSGGFQITNLSQVSSAGKPPLSSSSLKRKCNSVDDSKCGGSSGRCHCSKRRSALLLFFLATKKQKNKHQI